MDCRLLLALCMLAAARAAIAALVTAATPAPAAAPLELEARIPLGDVHGRIDHMAMDVARQRLFVAELGNDTVGVVDLAQRRTLRTIGGLREPQGIGYAASTDTLYVANAGDGTVRLYQGADLKPAGQIALGDDADNVRVDDPAHRLYVGYGSGAIAVIDTASRQSIAEVPLRAHPESFQLEPDSGRLYINIPDARQIAVVDRGEGKLLTTWPTAALRANFPMALDPVHRQVIVIFRHPATVGVFDARTGRLLSSAAACGDADDAFLDARRDRLYVSCGEGLIEVFAHRGEKFESIARITTSPGTRTSLFAASADRLFLAVRAGGAGEAAIWVYRPSP
ncbi:MAG: hypothetical protein JSR67_14945 [Proteobacteria bacterium]|nr:hypothetical protein [Pseudomonadota bacterium]